MLIQADLSKPIPLKENLVHAVILSPPYYGLRMYDVSPQIWGGSRTCNHTWTWDTKRGVTGGTKSKKVQIKDQDNFQIVPSTRYGFCDCGAWYGHLGQEPTPDMFIEHLVWIMDDVRRVMRPDAVLFVNIGDSFAGSGGPGSQYKKDGFQYFDNANKYLPLPNGNKILIPHRFAIAMQDDGWILKQDMVWAKAVSFNDEWSGSVMPEPVNGWRWERHKVHIKTNGKKEYVECPGCEKCKNRDGFVLRKGQWRPTTSHEYIFMFAKTDRYYADREAVKEALACPDAQGMLFGGDKQADGDNVKYSGNEYDASRLTGRNPRSVWAIEEEEWQQFLRWKEEYNQMKSVTGASTGNYKGHHFAAFGPHLVEPLIKAATPDGGVCRECGAPLARVIKNHSNTPGSKYDREEQRILKPHPPGVDMKERGMQNLGGNPQYPPPNAGNSTETLDWWHTCEHTSPSIPATVLDICMGTGSTAVAAQSLRRNWIGTDLSFRYLRQAQERTGITALNEWENGKDGECEVKDLPLFGG